MILFFSQFIDIILLVYDFAGRLRAKSEKELLSLCNIRIPDHVRY
jgi:hypothetical protein